MMDNFVLLDSMESNRYKYEIYHMPKSYIPNHLITVTVYKPNSEWVISNLEFRKTRKGYILKRCDAALFKHLTIDEHNKYMEMLKDLNILLYDGVNIYISPAFLLRML